MESSAIITERSFISLPLKLVLVVPNIDHLPILFLKMAGAYSIVKGKFYATTTIKRSKRSLRGTVGSIKDKMGMTTFILFVMMEVKKSPSPFLKAIKNKISYDFYGHIFNFMMVLWILLYNNFCNYIENLN